MRTVFEILPSSFNAENSKLICEVSDEGFTFCIKDEMKNSFIGLGVYHFEKKKASVGLSIALQVFFHQKEILSEKFKSICIVYSFPESALVPVSLYNKEKKSSLMNTLFGDLNEKERILTDEISEASMYNCYRIPDSIVEVLQEKFPSFSNIHQYSLLLKKPIKETELLSVIFYSNKIIVSVLKDGKYHLINHFNYKVPEDVSYTLLNICRQLDIKNPPLFISGLIEESSPLFKELYKYFEKIELASLPEGYLYSEDITRFPSHYFSHIFAADSCA